MPLNRLLNWISSRSLYLMAGGVFAGYAFPQLADFAGPFLPISIAGMMMLGIARIDSADTKATLRQWPMLIALVLWLLVACPLLTYVVASSLGATAGLVLALVLTAASPPQMSTVGLSWLLGLNPPLALTMVVAATLVSPLTLSIIVSSRFLRTS